MLHPSTPLVVTLQLLRSPGQEVTGRIIPVKVTLTLLRGENKVEVTSRDILPGSSQDIEMPVPSHLIPGGQPYSLAVVGEDYQRMEGEVFRHKVPLKIFTPKPLINIVMNSKVFIQSQTGIKYLQNILYYIPYHLVTAHISSYQTDLTPYPGQLRVTLLSPTGVVMRTWVGIQPMVCQYSLARNTPTGLWRITASGDNTVG